MFGLLKRSRHDGREAGAGELFVRVHGGYHPDRIYAEAGLPLRVVFEREESTPCSEQVIFPDFGKSATLPQGKRVAVELFPEEAGVYEFTCAMGMLHGSMVVAPRSEVAP